jgi:hypothetical protein
MMTTRYATVGELRSTARMAEVLVDAGYDPSNDHEMQIGMTAYEAALLVCTHTSSKPPARQTQKARAGRNDPCPCGSGKKYKKCCIDMDRPLSAANDSGPLIKFGPGVVPRLWDGDAAYYEDCDRLSEIICQDPAFAGIGYSAADIGLFLKSVNEKEPGLAEALKNSDQETWDAALDDLGDYFVREFGSLDFGRSLFKERCLEAAKRATSNAAVRALATGICLTLMAEVSTDGEDPLAHLLFRQAFIKAAADVRILNRMFDQFGDRDELQRLIETDDPSVPAKIQSIADGLSAFEQGQLRKDFDRSYKNLRYTIAEEEFPVPLPFATQMALVGKFASASRNKTPSMEELSAIIETFADELTEDDYVLYGKMLDGWLKENKKTRRPRRGSRGDDETVVCGSIDRRFGADASPPLHRK